MGYQSTDMELTNSYSSSSSDGFYSSSSSSSETNDYSVDGFAGGIFAGAKFSLGNGLFISPEVNLGTSNADGGQRGGESGSFEYNDDFISDSGSYNSSYNIEAEAGQSYGFGILLGKELSDKTSIYGRLGYQRTEYELTASTSYTDTYNGETSSDSFSQSDDETFGGIRYGLGLETAMTNNLALRLDWSLTDYSDESYSVTNQGGGTETAVAEAECNTVIDLKLEHDAA